MRAEILKYDVNAPREQGFSNQRMYPDNDPIGDRFDPVFCAHG
jgi:hypothetical protein